MYLEWFQFGVSVSCLMLTSGHLERLRLPLLCHRPVRIEPYLTLDSAWLTSGDFGRYMARNQNRWSCEAKLLSGQWLDGSVTFAVVIHLCG